MRIAISLQRIGAGSLGFEFNTTFMNLVSENESTARLVSSDHLLHSLRGERDFVST